MSFLIATALTTSALISQVAQGWQILDTENGCGMLATLGGQGGTELIFFEGLDGRYRLMAMNDGWSLEPGQKEVLYFWLDENAFAATAIGLKAGGGKPGFSVQGKADFRNAFLKAASLRIFRGTKAVIDLPLRETQAALSAVTACAENVRARQLSKQASPAEGGRVSSDPFKGGKEPSPLTYPGYWIKMEDYPKNALRAGDQGAVGVRVRVDATGKIVGCQVEDSSGSDILDRQTCSVVRRRGKFKPATDEKGQPIEGSLPMRFNWSIAG